jgi:hypothetical protein
MRAKRALSEHVSAASPYQGTCVRMSYLIYKLHKPDIQYLTICRSIFYMLERTKRNQNRREKKKLDKGNGLDLVILLTLVTLKPRQKKEGNREKRKTRNIKGL